ncbi:MAG TPA: CoA transferase [Desulfobacterales bacterium]|nr:CoA transferase [Desulfobacterales bacterium]
MELFSNITVLSLEQATVLPYLTFRLAQDGMEVIRLEHPLYGDPNRMVGEDVLGEERMYSYYLCINAGKKAVTLDLATAQGQELFRKMIKKLDVDIFATNQLPKNYKKLGIDYQTLKELKPDIIWVGVTGFGPEINEAAYDPILQARSGLMELTGEPDAPPQVLGIPLPDMGCSEHTYGLIMKALYKRALTGEGSCINVSMFESAVSWLTVPITLTATFNKTITRRGNTHEFFAPVSVFKTKDGFLYLAVGNNKQWKAMVSQEIFSSLDKPEYDKNEGRIKDVKKLNKAIEAITRNYSTEELMEIFKSIGVPVGEIKKISEVVKDPLVEPRLLYAQDPKTGLKVTLAPPPYTTPYLKFCKRELSFPPRFGEHNQLIFGEKLGYTEKQLKELEEQKVI